MPDPSTKRLLWYLFAGSRGGENRTRIIDVLKERPLNINQLSERLGLDYKAVQHHISVLEKNNLLSRMGEKYGVVYFVSTYLESNFDVYLDIRSKLRSVSPY
jgi:DNA-binding transcriptional ArsR family regulator